MNFHHGGSKLRDMHIRKNLIPVAGLMLVCLLVFAVGNSAASEEKEPAGCQYNRGVRAMGMGNAFAAIADDGDAFYYNPAGLAAVSGLRVDLQPLKLIPTEGLYDELSDIEQFVDDIEAISDSDEPLEDPALEDERRRVMERMSSFMTENLGLDVGAPFRAIIPLHVGDFGVAIGAMSQVCSSSQVHVRRRGLDWDDFVKDMLDDEIIYHVMAEASYGFGAAVEMPLRPLPVEVSAGFTARRIQRWQMTDEDDPMGVEDIISPYGKDEIKGTADDFANRFFDPEDPLDSVMEGKGYGLDAGVIASMDDIVSFAAVSHNLLGRIKYEDEESRALERNFGIAAAANLAKVPTPDIPMLDVIVAAGLDSNSGLDEESDFIDHARLGLEVIWHVPLLAVSGRIGSNRGYLTLGAGIQLAVLDLDYAYYGDQGTNWHAFSLNLAF